MHPRFATDDFELIAELILNRFYQRCAAFHIEHAHFTNMPGEMATADESRHDRLIQRRRKLVASVSHRGEGFNQVLGNDNVAQTQSRKHHLAKSAHINHASADVQSLQRRNWPGPKPEFAIVVILDNPSSGTRSPVK